MAAPPRTWKAVENRIVMIACWPDVLMRMVVFCLVLSLERPWRDGVTEWETKKGLTIGADAQIFKYL